MNAIPEQLRNFKVTRIVIRNYRGIEAREVAFPKAGAVIKGRNGAGKTTTIRAITACLAGKDIGADAIRNGADKAEIIVDLDHLQVKRQITKNGSTISVREHGKEKASPAKFLADLLGDCAIDPVALITKKPAERRAAVLAAMPVTVSEERVRGWAPGLPAGFSFDGHGLDVVKRAHEYFYDERKLANAKAKDAASTAEHLAKETREVPVAPTVEEAASTIWRATEALANLQARRDAFVAATERTQKTRDRITEIEAEASTLERLVVECPVTQSDFENAEAVAGQASELVERIDAQLAAAKEALGKANLNRSAIADQLLTAMNAADRAKELRASAGKLAEAIEQVSPDVADDMLAQAKADREAATAEVALAAEADAARKAIGKTMEAEAAAVELQGKADALDAIVRTLADVAPVELLSEADGIEGLSLVGDDVAWNGVTIGHLCGAEQVRFCVDIARRLNAKSKILVCDGLERLDPEQLDVFLPWATRDGWQLIATRVDRGEVVTEAIEEASVAA